MNLISAFDNISVLRGTPTFLICIGLLLFSGCSNVRHLSGTEALVTKNKIILDAQENLELKRQLKRKLKSLARQKPNKKALGFFRLKLRAYTIGSKGKLNRFNNWLQTKVGEAPVLFDSIQSNASVKLMENYLFNSGYFHAEIEYETRVRRKRAKVRYKVKSKQLYTFGNISYHTVEGYIQKIFRWHEDKTLLIPGEPYDINKISQERERITNHIKDEGYYYFTKTSVQFDADSTVGDRKVDLNQRIIPPPQGSHQRYQIHDVFVYLDHGLAETNRLDTFLVDGYNLIGSKLDYNPDILLGAIFIKPAKMYSKKNYDLSLFRLLGLGTFKFVSIRYIENNSEPGNTLDCHIYLTRSKVNEITIESELNTNTRTTSDFPLGTALNISYKTKNLFNNADLFIVNMAGGVEMQFGKDVLFSTVDLSPQLNFYFPKFLLPFRLRNLSPNVNPKTRISASYNFLKREGDESYAINFINFSFGYEWNETRTKRHIVNPLVISLVNQGTTSQAFRDRLDNDPLLRTSFEEQFIIGSNYTFLLNNQFLSNGYFLYFKGNLDLAGNLLQAVNQISNSKSETYSLFGINYSQYVRTDLDLRLYQVFNPRNTIIYRLAGGLGLPFGNSEVLPYIKQFYIGGANSLRAWRVRTLGPGSFDSASDTTDIFADQTADMRIETNMEYRFDIFEILKGALFLDGGNIWTLKKDSLREGTQFTGNFLDQFAVGGGIGARFDFSYFIIRLDLATPFRNPALPKGEQWVIDKIALGSLKWRRENLLLNLAIGYPF